MSAKDLQPRPASVRAAPPTTTPTQDGASERATPTAVGQLSHQAVPSPATHHLLGLQRTVGNRQVSRMLAQRATHVEDTRSTEIPANHDPTTAQLHQSLERFGSFSTDELRVHKAEVPSDIHAVAYTRGPDVYVTPGSEATLPREAMHVVQGKA
jgi:hypothetical protein